jgi:adenylosuccinate synthase
MHIDVILGLQWGDEGKGKIVDYLAPQYQIVARFQGGPNAGHTLLFGGKKYVLHTVPSGIFQEGLINVVGNGVVLDPVVFQKELSFLESCAVEYRTRLLLARKAHLIMPTHRWLDAANEAQKGKEKIGSTLKGIGPTYMDKTGRNGIRLGDIVMTGFESYYKQLKAKHLSLLRIYPEVPFDIEQEESVWFESLEKLRKLQFIDCEYYINEAVSEGQKVLAEGAQGSMLDVDFGTYPFVTSSNTVTAGVCTGLGVAPARIGKVIGITKAYCTRVGGGPFPTELEDATGEELRKQGHEFGSTTGRPRRCGWIDLPQLRYTIMLNGVTSLCMTKIDVLDHFETLQAATAYRYEGRETTQLPFDLCKTDVQPVYTTFEGWQQSLADCTTYEALPHNAKQYISSLENVLEVPFDMISTGPEREKLLLKAQ